MSLIDMIKYGLWYGFGVVQRDCVTDNVYLDLFVFTFTLSEIMVLVSEVSR